MRFSPKAEIGERVVIVRDGEAILAFTGVVSASRRGGLDLDKLPEILRRHGIKPGTPEENAAWKKDISDPAFSREVLGLGDDWDPTR